MSRPPQNLIVNVARRSFMIALIAAAIACLTAAPLLAQVTSGTIFGTVKDSSGAYVKGATVTIADPSNGLTRTVTTSDSGEFSAPGLYPGTYTITVEAKGFKKLESSGFVLSAADKLGAGELVLAVGAATDSVTVTADAGQVQLQSDSGERSDVITGKQINEIALNGRNVLDYLKLIPGMSGRSMRTRRARAGWMPTTSTARAPISTNSRSMGPRTWTLAITAGPMSPSIRMRSRK